MRHALLLVPVLVTLSAPAAAQDCAPACRSGYVCLQGQCVSRCNPPCAAGETCQANGECAPAQLVPAPGYAPPPPVSAVPVGVKVSEGWARGAGIMGSITAGLLVGAMVLPFTNIGNVGGVVAGAMATVLGGVMIPLTAAGAGSARVESGVPGVLALRIVGWVTYGLFMSGAVVLLSLGIAGLDVPAPAILGVVLTGVVSAGCMVVDAFVSAAQVSAFNENRAPAAARPAVRAAPWVAVVPTPGRGGATVMAGVGMTF